MFQNSDFRIRISEFRSELSTLDSRLSTLDSRLSTLDSRLLRSGFTLVELLTVIIIIGILAGLITAAAVPAMRTAREYTIRQDIAQLEEALEKYKQERGDYPPDFAGVGAPSQPETILSSAEAQSAVLLHFRKAFPRYTPGANPYKPSGADTRYEFLLCDISYATRSDPDIENSGIAWTAINFNPATALVFILGGPPAPEGSSTKLLGFSANPANPFARGGSRLPTLYEFDETRLHISYEDGVPLSLPVFIPPHMPQLSDGTKAPYVYFRPRNRVYFRTPATAGNMVLPYYFGSMEQGICVPYADTAIYTDANITDVKRWMEPTKYQIICAGLDGLFREQQLAHDPPLQTTDKSYLETDFGSDSTVNVRFLSGEAANIAPEEDDNITNFTQGKLADRAEQ